MQPLDPPIALICLLARGSWGSSIFAVELTAAGPLLSEFLDVDMLCWGLGGTLACRLWCTLGFRLGGTQVHTRSAPPPVLLIPKSPYLEWNHVTWLLSASPELQHKAREVEVRVYGVRCAVCGVWCTVHGVRCAVYGVPCAVCGVRCAVYGVACAVCGVRGTVYGVLSTVYGVRCTV